MKKFMQKGAMRERVTDRFSVNCENIPSFPSFLQSEHLIDIDEESENVLCKQENQKGEGVTKKV